MELCSILFTYIDGMTQSAIGRATDAYVAGIFREFDYRQNLEVCCV